MACWEKKENQWSWFPQGPQLNDSWSVFVPPTRTIQIVLTLQINTQCITVLMQDSQKACILLLETAAVNTYMYVPYCQSNPWLKSHIHSSLIDSLAASYVTLAPPCPWPGCPRNHSHPESHDPEHLNKYFHLLQKTSTQVDCVVCSKTERFVIPSYKWKPPTSVLEHASRDIIPSKLWTTVREVIHSLIHACIQPYLYHFHIHTHK